jgi:hypothetical protein
VRYETNAGAATATEAFYGINYAIQVGNNGPIKIGFTTATGARRLRQLQQACPYELRLLEEWRATVAHEGRIHRLLAPYRLRAEWYHPVTPVLEFIAAEVVAAAEREPARLSFVSAYLSPPAREGAAA